MTTKFAATALIITLSLIASSMAFAGDRSEQDRTARSYAVRTGFNLTRVESGVTREQVNAELAAAIRSGDILANGQSGLKLNELYPSRYPAKPVQASVSPEQVKAELADAIRSGDIVANGQSGLKLNELYPSLYPAKPVQANLTREQVKAELAAAFLTGDFFLAGENGGKCNEVHPAMHSSL